MQAYRGKGNSDDGHAELQSNGVRGVGASRIPRSAGSDENQRRAEYLDQDRLYEGDFGVNDGDAERRRRSWIAIVHQVHRRHYLYEVRKFTCMRWGLFSYCTTIISSNFH